jgi:hypothetical protein
LLKTTLGPRGMDKILLSPSGEVSFIAYDAVEATTDWTPESPQVEFYRREGRERAPIVAHWCSGYYGLAENDARAPWDG